MLVSEAIDKTTIDDLLLEYIINNNLLIEMPVKNNLQQNFTLHFWSFLSCVADCQDLLSCLSSSPCSLGHINHLCWHLCPTRPGPATRIFSLQINSAVLLTILNSR